MSIALTGGGTGGHLCIIKSIKDELNKRGIKPIYIGSTSTLDTDWFRSDVGIAQSYFFPVRGVANRGFLGKINSMTTILKYMYKCKNIFQDHSIKKVFCVGGYAAAPAVFAALLCRKKIYIHEQNSMPGYLNRLLKPFSKRYFNSYENSNFVDYPVSEIFFDKSRLRKEIKTIIFLGGSQGASFINKFALSVAKKISSMGIEIIHQTGNRDFEESFNYYKQHHINADVFKFSREIALKMQKADFAISRAGASMLWEIAASNLPTLFIPYPYAALNHQFYNAKYLSDKGAAFLVDEKIINAKKLYSILKEDIEPVSKMLKSVIKRGGAKEIVDFLL